MCVPMAEECIFCFPIQSQAEGSEGSAIGEKDMGKGRLHKK